MNLQQQIQLLNMNHHLAQPIIINLLQQTQYISMNHQQYLPINTNPALLIQSIKTILHLTIMIQNSQKIQILLQLNLFISQRLLKKLQQTDIHIQRLTTLLIQLQQQNIEHQILHIQLKFKGDISQYHQPGKAMFRSIMELTQSKLRK